MENILQTIIKKLEGIDERLKTLEVGPKTASTVSGSDTTVSKKPKDALFAKAWSVVSKTDNELISTELLVKELHIDEKRAEMIFDQLEEAGYGACEWKES